VTRICSTQTLPVARISFLPGNGPEWHVNASKDARCAPYDQFACAIKPTAKSSPWNGHRTIPGPRSQWAVGIQEWYSPSVLNSGADGWFTTGNITYTVPSAMLPGGIGMLISGDAGYWALGTSDNFYCTTSFPGAAAAVPPVCTGVYPGGVPYKSYWTWDVGVSFTYKAFTLDLRYYDTNLTKAECNVFTSDHTATFSTSNITNLNPGGLGSNWCDAAFIAKLSFATNLSNIK
jgi:hypothetical protein